MQLSTIGMTAGLTETGANATANSVSSKSDDFASILADFMKEAAKSPAERARDAVLKAHGLTEQQYNALPAGQKDAITREISDAVRRALQAGHDGSSRADTSAQTPSAFIA